MNTLNTKISGLLVLLFLLSGALLYNNSLYADSSQRLIDRQVKKLEQRQAITNHIAGNLLESMSTLREKQKKLAGILESPTTTEEKKKLVTQQLNLSNKRIISYYKRFINYKEKSITIKEQLVELKDLNLSHTATDTISPVASHQTSTLIPTSGGSSTTGGLGQVTSGLITTNTTTATIPASNTTTPTGGSTQVTTPSPANTFTINGVQYLLSSCASENAPCNFSGTRHVAYGASGSYSVGVFQSSILCSNQNFVDPIFGTTKHCFVSVDTTTSPQGSGTSTNTQTQSPTISTPTSPTESTTTSPSGNTSQTNGNGTISLRLNASRISGTAPLAVHFDASDTTTTIPNIYSFHDIRYSFNFGDERNQTWSVSGLSKNTQTGGPIAAHVFDVPGVYTVRVSASHPGGSMVETTITITVSNPDTVFQGQSTICVSLVGNYTGCPSGAQQLRSLPSSTALNNSRLLLRRGESFGSISINHGARNVQIGAYGTGNKPRVEGVYIGTFRPDSSSFPEDITIMDLSIQQGLEQYASISRLLVYKNDFTPPTGSELRTQIILASALGYVVDNHTLPANQYYQPRELFVVENYVRGNMTNAHVNMTGEGSKFVIMGNDMGTAQQHTVRLWAMNRGFIAHNALRGQSLDAIRLTLKLHSGGFGEFNDNYAISRGAWATRKVVIANNRLGDQNDNNYFIGGAGPENTESGQGLEDVILENNRFVRGVNTNTEFILMGRRMTTRGNNRLDGGVPNINQFDNAYQLIPPEWNGPYFVQ